jgi:predicted RNA-binding Zn-ribbon protein involved in translation (DUF1610 family)
MNNQRSTWFSFSSPESPSFPCAACGQQIDLGRTADHHPGYCPHCGEESAFLNWKGRTVQIVPKKAPPPLAGLIRWAQQHLDELEYVELICALEEIADAINAVAVHS